MSGFNAQPRHVAFVSLLDSGKWGASEYLWSQAARKLAGRGHRVTACTHGWPERATPIEALRNQGVALVERSPVRAGRWRDFITAVRNPARLPALHSRPLRQLVRSRPDLVLLSSPWVIGHHLTGWCDELHANGIPYAFIIHTHAGHFWPTGYVSKRLANAFNRSVAVFCVSEDNRRLFERQLDLRPGLLSIVRNPLAVDRNKAPVWPEDPVARLACVGRLDPAQKGQDVFLECLEAPVWRERSYMIGFFGEGPGRQTLEKLSSVLPAGVATFHGHVQDPSKIWETHQLLVFPSRFEGLGLAVAEAQLCGRPVVVSDCAARELVLDGVTGFVAEGTSARALGAALERAWAARAHWAAMGVAARRHMLDTLPSDPVGEFADILTSLLPH